MQYIIDNPILINCVRMHDPVTRSLTGNFSHCLHLIEAIEKLKKLNLYVHADALTAPHISAIVPPERLVVEGQPIDTILQMELAIARAIRKVRPILYHKPTGQLPLIPVKCRTVWGVADLGYRHLPMGFLQRMYKRLSYSSSAGRANHITAISNSVRDEIISALHVSPGKVSTIYHGTSEFSSDAEVVPNCPPVFLMTFGHQRHKNVETCVAVIKELKSADIHMPLLVVGRVEQQRQLEAQSQKMGVQDNIRFCGRVSNGQLRFLYERAVCLLFLSRHEGFGLPVLEAMGLGCPVIASNVFSLPEVVSDAAPMFDCDDAAGVAKEIRQLCRNPGIRERRIKSGYENAARFTWRRAAEETIAIYKAVLELQ